MYVNSGRAGDSIEALPQEGDDLGLWVSWATLLLESGNNSRTNLWVGLEMTGAPIINNHVVMGYLQFQDPEATGKYQTFTCTTRHWREGVTDIAKWFDVGNFYGTQSFAGLQGSYDSLNPDE